MRYDPVQDPDGSHTDVICPCRICQCPCLAVFPANKLNELLIDEELRKRTGNPPGIDTQVDFEKMLGSQIQTNLIQLVQSEGVERCNLRSEHGHPELCQDVLGMSSASIAGDQALQQNTKLRRSMQKAIGPLSNREQVSSYFCICSNANQLPRR